MSSIAGKKLRITNIFGEFLDAVLSGNPKASAVNVYVHGFGTDKNEGFASFLDLSRYFDKKFLNIRFDFSGYGKSGGKDYKFTFHKAANDLQSVLVYVKNKWPKKRINIIAHSLGTFVTLLLQPAGIHKTIFTAPVNANTKYISKWLEKRIKSKGGVVDKTGITVYLRTSGAIQLIGSDFWHILENFNVEAYLKAYVLYNDLTVFKPVPDNVLPYKYFETYKQVLGDKYIEIPGDHNYSDTKDRKNLIKLMEKVLLQR